MLMLIIGVLVCVTVLTVVVVTVAELSEIDEPPAGHLPVIAGKIGVG